MEDNQESEYILKIASLILESLSEQQVPSYIGMTALTVAFVIQCKHHEINKKEFLEFCSDAWDLCDV